MVDIQLIVRGLIIMGSVNDDISQMHWCQFEKDNVYNPDVNKFLEEVLAVCRKHQMELWPSDSHGGLVVEKYSDDYDFLKDADIGKTIETKGGDDCE